jgi:hypothetical protein
MASCKSGYARCPPTGSCLSMSTLSNCGSCGNKCGSNSACVRGSCECKTGYMQDPLTEKCVRPEDLLKTCYSKGVDKCEWPCALRKLGGDTQTQKCLSPYDPFAEIISVNWNNSVLTVGCRAQFTQYCDSDTEWRRCTDQVTILVDGVPQPTQMIDENGFGYHGIQYFIVSGVKPNRDKPNRVQLQITPLVGQKFISEPVQLRW